MASGEDPGTVEFIEPRHLGGALGRQTGTPNAAGSGDPGNVFCLNHDIPPSSDR